MIAAKNEFKSLLKENYKKSLQFNFFYPFTNTVNNLTGMISPGFDKSEREFPFTIFYIMNKYFYNHIPVYLIPLVNYRNLEYYKELCEYSRMSKDLLSINDEMNKIVYKLYPSNASMDYQKFLSTVNQEIFWERTFGNFTCSSKYALINRPVPSLDPSNTGLSVSANLFDFNCQSCQFVHDKFTTSPYRSYIYNIKSKTCQET